MSTICTPTSIGARAIAAKATGGAALEIKEWQAIMQHLQSMPVTAGDTLPTMPTDGAAREIRFPAEVRLARPERCAGFELRHRWDGHT
jgi:hypothetical protein